MTPGAKELWNQGYRNGLESVRQRPTYAPRNPYDEDTQPIQYAAWEDGAYVAGITEFYTNGVLDLDLR